jgi:hypothetical protein
MVEKIHKDFVTATGDDNVMDKREFRRLFKKMHINTQASSLPSALPPMYSEDELNKMSDYVFETYDFEETGMIFVITSNKLFYSLSLYNLGLLTFEGRTIFQRHLS